MLHKRSAEAWEYRAEGIALALKRRVRSRVAALEAIRRLGGKGMTPGAPQLGR